MGEGPSACHLLRHWAGPDGSLACALRIASVFWVARQRGNHPGKRGSVLSDATIHQKSYEFRGVCQRLFQDVAKSPLSDFGFMRGNAMRGRQGW